MPHPAPPDDKTVRQYQENDDEAAALDTKKQHVEELLDEALMETFPASDPISIGTSTPPPCSEKDQNRARTNQSSAHQ